MIRVFRFVGTALDTELTISSDSSRVLDLKIKDKGGKVLENKFFEVNQKGLALVSFFAPKIFQWLDNIKSFSK